VATLNISTSPPKVLTTEEYRAHWQPEGWQLIIIGPTPTWRQEWGEWEAIRDIVQNALDESEAYYWGYDDKGLWIADRGRGVAVADFLLGPPKLKSDYARGKYGEGMKVATLALIRRGYSVHIQTVGREFWIIFLEQEADIKIPTLSALWRPGGTRIGTRFHILGYTGDAFADRFAVNLPRIAVIADGPSRLTRPVRRFNQLIQTGSGSRIYARDIYMRDLKSPYSYNLWGFDMAPDRYGPKNEPDLWVDMGRLWCCISKVSLLEVFLKMMRNPPEIESEESHNLRMDSWSMGNEPVTGKTYADFIAENASSWREAWRDVYGDDAVLRTDERWDGTVRHLGYTPISINYPVLDTLSRVIPTDSKLVKASQERLREAKVIPDASLTPRQRSHLKLARAIVGGTCRSGSVPTVHAAIIPPASDRVRTAGMYGRITQEIFIASDQLERGSATVDTVIHEIAHHTSGAEDLEQSHSLAMTQVAARVVKAAAAGDFDELLKEAVW